MRKPIALVAALLLSTSLAVAACGDDGDDDAGGSTASAAEETTTTGGPDDATTTTAGEATGDEGDAPGEGADPDSDYCRAAQTLATDQTLADLDFTDAEQTGHAIELLSGLRDNAPDEVADAVQTVIEAFEAVTAAFTEAGDDPQAQAAALTALQGEYAERLGPATQTVQTYTQEQCGIDVSGGAG